MSKSHKNWGSINRGRRRKGSLQAATEAAATTATYGQSAPVGPTAIRLDNSVGVTLTDVAIQGFATGISMAGSTMSATRLMLRGNQRGIVASTSTVDLVDSEIN